MLQMYGMVNKAVRGFVLKHYDEATWTKIHTNADVPGEFVAMQSYDDTVTYALVGAAHEALGLEVEDILRGFGQFWVSDVAVATYRDVMDKSGTTFVDFLKNLDHLHDRIRVNFPEYEPPSFRVVELGEGALQVDYYSKREGLMPFVRGLFEGLATHFEVAMSIEVLPDDTHPMPCKRMHVQYSSA